MESNPIKHYRAEAGQSQVAYMWPPFFSRREEGGGGGGGLPQILARSLSLSLFSRAGSLHSPEIWGKEREGWGRRVAGVPVPFCSAWIIYCGRPCPCSTPPHTHHRHVMHAWHRSRDHTVKGWWCYLAVVLVWLRHLIFLLCVCVCVFVFSSLHILSRPLIHMFLFTVIVYLMYRSPPLPLLPVTPRLWTMQLDRPSSNRAGTPFHPDTFEPSAPGAHPLPVMTRYCHYCCVDYPRFRSPAIAG